MQNADDAGAEEVVFVSDEREFDISRGGLKGTQGEKHCGHWERLDRGQGWHWEGLGACGWRGIRVDWENWKQ